MADSLVDFGTAGMTGRHNESVAERCSFGWNFILSLNFPALVLCLHWGGDAIIFTVAKQFLCYINNLFDYQ